MLPVSGFQGRADASDIDILAFYLGGPKNPAKKVSSFGSLFHFKPSRKPKEAQGANNCLECPHEAACAWSAKKAYLEPITKGLVAQGENVSQPSTRATMN